MNGDTDYEAYTHAEATRGAHERARPTAITWRELIEPLKPSLPSTVANPNGLAAGGIENSAVFAFCLTTCFDAKFGGFLDSGCIGCVVAFSALTPSQHTGCHRRWCL